MRPATAPRQVLLVDDDPDFGDSLADLLEDAGYSVRVARGAASAVTSMQESPADLALVDMRLGTGSGIDMIEELLAGYQDLTWIAVTAFASVDTAVDALRHGAYAYLRKPFHPDELTATLERAFERIELARHKRAAERALRRYEQIVSSTSDLMAYVDENLSFQAINDAYLAAYCRERDDVVGARVADLHGQEMYVEQMEKPLERCLAGEQVRFQVWCNLPASGRHFIEFALYPYQAQGPDERGVVLSGRDLTDAQSLSERLAYQARHDDLTGLVNRREFEKQLRSLIESARAGATHALCYLDLDQFKVVNDTCGHVAGDELLRQLGVLLPSVVRKGDVVARLGGDEFGVLIVGCSLEQARRVGDALLETVSGFHFRWEKASFNVGVSIGLVSITGESGGLDGVMTLADRACYAAKESGRNRVHVFREDDTRLTQRHGEMQWVSRIQKALLENRFFLELQPIRSVNPTNGPPEGYEALLRMREEDGSVAYPRVFLPAAERYGLAARLDTWVSGQALNMLRDGVLPGDSRLMVNLSGHSLGDESFRSTLLDALEIDRPASGRLCFEITETAAIANLSSAMRFMADVREYGCLFALDDFGSGLSSFAYLKNLPVDFVKIDGQFVRDIEDDPIDFAMVKSINEIGHVMGKTTIAEFVENEQILNRLREIGVEYAQGFHIGHPAAIASLLPQDVPAEVEPLPSTTDESA